MSHNYRKLIPKQWTWYSTPSKMNSGSLG